MSKKDEEFIEATLRAAIDLLSENCFWALVLASPIIEEVQKVMENENARNKKKGRK